MKRLLMRVMILVAAVTGCAPLAWAETPGSNDTVLISWRDLAVTQSDYSAALRAIPESDRMGQGCRISPSVTVFRPTNAHPGAAILLRREVSLFDKMHLLLGEIDAQLELGDRVIINVGCYVSGEGGLVIEQDVMLGPHVRLMSAGHTIHGHDPVVARNRITYGAIRFAPRAWIAGGVMVMEGVRIGAGTIVGAGNVVTRNVPPFAVAIGNPARIVRCRFGHGPALPWWRRLV
jgi:acetyltransferase-like isoleucine patch superfamily enzyme